MVRQRTTPPGKGEPQQLRGSTSPGGGPSPEHSPRAGGPRQIRGPLWGVVRQWATPRGRGPPAVKGFHLPGGWPVAGAPSGEGGGPAMGHPPRGRGLHFPGGGLSPEQPPGEGAPADKWSPLGGWSSNGPPPRKGGPGS